MSWPPTSSSPVRDRSCDGLVAQLPSGVGTAVPVVSRYPSPPDQIRRCANADCTNLLDSGRSIYCSPACKQRCYRARHARPRLATVGTRPKRVQTDRVTHSVYECSSCGERFVGLRRCPDCNLFLANLGLGGACVHCDEPLLLTELLGDGGATLLD